MKFLIKTSAVGISDKKFTKQGNYETEDRKEIERLQDIAKKFPDDVEEIKGKEAPKQNTQKKNESKKNEDDKAPENKTPKDDPKKAGEKPAEIAKK